MRPAADVASFMPSVKGTRAWLVCGWRSWWITVVKVLLNAAKFPLPRRRGGEYAGRQARPEAARELR
jgi:hypothetical protein